jgi:hypothetical protein
LALFGSRSGGEALWVVDGLEIWGKSEASGEHSHAGHALQRARSGSKEEQEKNHAASQTNLGVHGSSLTKMFGATEEGQLSHAQERFRNTAHGHCQLGYLAARAVDAATIGKEQKAFPS